MRGIMRKTPGRPEPESLDVLKQIIAEVDGKRQPYSAHSYLPEHLIKAAKLVIAQEEMEWK